MPFAGSATNKKIEVHTRPADAYGYAKRFSQTHDVFLTPWKIDKLLRGIAARRLGDAMIDRTIFDRIKQRHGDYASWAVWAEASGSPKSDVGDMHILDPDKNPALLKTLRNDVVMIGLNISRSFSEPFRNFHDASSKANDFKIRFAFTDTIYCGAYMTDIVKHEVMVESARLMERLKANPTIISRNVESFLRELADLQCVKPTFLAFGADAHRLVADNVPTSAYSRLVKLTHYSHRVSKEKYRQEVLARIGS